MVVDLQAILQKLPAEMLSSVRSVAREVGIEDVDKKTKFQLIMALRKIAGKSTPVQPNEPPADDRHERWMRGAKRFKEDHTLIRKAFRRGKEFESRRQIPTWVGKKYKWIERRKLALERKNR